MAASNGSVTQPVEVELRQDEVSSPRFTPRELRTIKEHTGRSFTQILTDEGDDDKYTIMAWLKLRRNGLDIGWDDMDDVIITIGGTPDPTTGSPGITSPRSASSGE